MRSRVAIALAITLAGLACSPTAPTPSMSVHVQVDLFSGRPNPEWDLTAEETRQFFEMFGRLAPAAEPGSAPPTAGLGYRGVRVSAEDRGTPMRLLVVERAVYSEAAGSSNGRRLDDPNRGLERWLLKTGASTLGADLLESLLRD